MTSTAEFNRFYQDMAVPTLPDELSGYRFVSCFSDGEHKKTWLLERPNGQKVLCKYAKGEYAAMLRTESSFFSYGKFPFIPCFYDYFETENGAYLLREYIEGSTLEELVEKEGPLSLDRAVLLMRKVLCFFSRFHAASPPIIYRDLKPANIVLHPSGDLYLIDMGTARAYHEDNSPDTVFMGTSVTAAPEQFGARQTDERTDIYGLGILFYYLLTGELKIQETKLHKLPPRAAAFIKKCAAFDPDDRYYRVSQVETALDAVISPINKKRLAVVFSAVCLLLATALFLIPRLPHPDKEVTFSSAPLEQAVREAVDKVNGEPVYESDLALVTHILICGDTVFPTLDAHTGYGTFHLLNGERHVYNGDITDISLLAKMPNLRYVTLDFQNIKDISALADLHLVSLSICGNPVTDLSALQGMETLSALYIADTEVASLAPLSECANLHTLDCADSPVTSVAPLSALPLRELNIMGIPAGDFEILAALPLEKLSASYLTKEKYLAFADISTLQDLTLQNCDIISIKELSDFNKLIRLDIRFNQLTDLDGLEVFTDMRVIVLSNNPLTDLYILTKMEKLEDLGLSLDTEVDFSFLNEMPWVDYVTIHPSQADALYEAVPEPWFSLAWE